MRHDDIVPNFHPAQNDGAGAYLSAVADFYRTFGQLDFLRVPNREDASNLGVSRCGAKRVRVVVENAHVGADHDAIADLDGAAGPYPSAFINIAIASDFDIAAVGKDEKFAAYKRISADPDVFAACARVKYPGFPAENGGGCEFARRAS